MIKINSVEETGSSVDRPRNDKPSNAVTIGKVWPKSCLRCSLSKGVSSRFTVKTNTTISITPKIKLK